MQPFQIYDYNKDDPFLKHPLYILAKVSQFLCFIGLGMIIFGTFFARIFIRLIYTDKWATDSACDIMRAYCIYTFFMALNGVAEAYVYSRADSQTLRKLQYSLLATSIVYIMASLILSDWIGITGLIYANCINMGLRIVTSIYFSLQLEATPMLGYFMSNLITVDIGFIVNLVKQRLSRFQQVKKTQ